MPTITFQPPFHLIVPSLPGTTNPSGLQCHFLGSFSLILTIFSHLCLDIKTVLRLQRADAAAINGFETLGLYAGGIAAAGAAGVPAITLNYLGLTYVVSRAAYNVVYIVLQDNRKFAPVRSLVWNVGLVVIFTLWIKAGNAAAAK